MSPMQQQRWCSPVIPTQNFNQIQAQSLPDTLPCQTYWSNQTQHWQDTGSCQGTYSHQDNLSGQAERERLEKKRERNRVAANKCRLRKIERIAQLDSEVNKLKAENSELVKVRQRLEMEAMELRITFKKHLDCGCIFESEAPSADSTSFFSHHHHSN